MSGKKSEHYFTCRVKEYPGYNEYLACDVPAWRGVLVPGVERVEAGKPLRCVGEESVDPSTAEPSAENLERARRRARARLRDYALCNPMEYFVTLTVDKDRADRYDEAGLVRRVNKWMDNQYQQNGVQAVIVPERHKDGAIHFHGLLRGVSSERMFDSGTVVPPGGGKPKKPRSKKQREEWLSQGGKVVYNLTSWRLGFSTCMKLYGEYEAAVGYVCKYIGKDIGGGKIGGRWYYHSGGLALPAERYETLSFWDVAQMDGAYKFDIPAAGRSFACARVQKGGEENG